MKQYFICVVSIYGNRPIALEEQIPWYDSSITNCNECYYYKKCNYCYYKDSELCRTCYKKKYKIGDINKWNI